jgi:hypothetical protein
MKHLHGYLIAIAAFALWEALALTERFSRGGSERFASI